MRKNVRRSARSRTTRTTVQVATVKKAIGYKAVPRRASITFPSTQHAMHKVLRMNKQIKAGKTKQPKMKGAHPLHDPTGRIHAMTGAHLTDGHLRPHSAITHMRPYKIPKGMHPKKRMG